jgi:hypothetical protein
MIYIYLFITTVSKSRCVLVVSNDLIFLCNCFFTFIMELWELEGRFAKLELHGSCNTGHISFYYHANEKFPV